MLHSCSGNTIHMFVQLFIIVQYPYYRDGSSVMRNPLGRGYKILKTKLGEQIRESTYLRKTKHVSYGNIVVFVVKLLYKTRGNT